MGMSKEELKEMIDNVIVSNGKGQITADVLNLVLNNIAENAGGGGGVKILFLTHDLDVIPEVREAFFNHNAEIYNTIIEKYIPLMQCGPDNANELLPNIVNILNDSFFKAYDLIGNYIPGEVFSAEADYVFMYEFGGESESDIFIKFNCFHNSSTYELYPNGEFIYGPIVG